MHPIFFVICFYILKNEKRKNPVLNAQNFKNNSVPYFYFVCNLCTSTVPLPHYHNFGIRDKGFPHSTRTQAHTTTHKKESPGNILLPGPPICIKGLPRYLSRTPIHLPFLYIISPYRFMNSILLFKYLNMDICQSTIINPYIIQISFKVKVII